jgi:hypothetical protein
LDSLSDEASTWVLVAYTKGPPTYFRNVVTGAAQLRRAALLATAVVASTPLVAAAAPRHDGTPARITAAAAGVVYGGVTPDGFGLMVEVNKSRRKIVRMVTGLRTVCTSGGIYITPDNWTDLRVIQRGKFSASYGPEVERNDDGTTTDVEGTVSGKFNSSRTSVSGTWSLKLTHRDAAGTVLDTCDFGIVNWKAKQ